MQSVPVAFGTRHRGARACRYVAPDAVELDAIDAGVAQRICMPLLLVGQRVPVWSDAMMQLMNLRVPDPPKSTKKQQQDSNDGQQWG